ncbi:hypothetical protein [Paenibacillus sp. UASWS1643]|uniref:hypothetical protein n=1 Tax=Paenibacillus sp. UASWS1643 TaxID=2580422 RepID=UPI00123C2912|nr:hypothetical protein [Paenibacillus sp. UASWS1643]KAA8750175.1 hypothetical protein FE296_16410 [Paenibacillus sp. UASWS1643]
MKTFKRIINATIYVGLVAAACFGLTIAIGSIMNVGNSPLFRIGLVVILAALFIQGYTSGGDGDSEAKTAD